MLAIKEGMRLTLDDWKPTEYVTVFKVEGDLFKGSYVEAVHLEEFPVRLNWLLYQRLEIQNV